MSGDDAFEAAFNGVYNATSLQGLTDLQPGQKVAVLVPDNLSGQPGNIGYYAHALSTFAGKSGHVYDIFPPDLKEEATSGRVTVNGHVVTGDYADTNAPRLFMPFSNLGSLPELDLIWANDVSYFKPIEASSLIFNLMRSIQAVALSSSVLTARECVAQHVAVLP